MRNESNWITPATEIEVVTRYGRHEMFVRCIPPAKRLLAVARSCFLPKDGIESEEAEDVVSITVGEILFPRRKKDGLRYDRYSGGLFDAIRGRAQVMLGYGVGDKTIEGEVQRLSVLQSSVREIWAMLAAYGNFSDSEKRKLTAALESAAGDLSRVRDEDKVAAKGQLAASAAVTDSLARENPGMARARLVSGLRHLDIRLEAIRQITPRVGFYELVLVNERDRIFAVFRELGTVLCNLVGRRGILRSNPAKIKRSQQGIIARLHQCSEILRTIALQPFMSARNNLIVEIEEACVLLHESLIDSARSKLTSCLAVATNALIQKRFEQIRLELSCSLASGAVPKQLSEELENFRLWAESSSVYKISGISLKSEWRLAVAGAAQSLANEDGQTAKELLSGAADMFTDSRMTEIRR